MSFARLFSSLVLLAVLSGGLAVRAQDFQPPRPPPLDPATDFEDMEEDMMELGDEGYRPPGVPPGPGGNHGPGAGSVGAPPPPPAYDTASGSAFGSSGAKSSKNNPFQIVPGEFYDPKVKKKRGRGVMRRIDAPSGGKG